MAGQTKNASTSILQRVLDRTPLRQAHLTGFRSAAAISPAQFVARYFDRNFGILQRWMGSGGSPIRANSISRSLVARYTSFNQSFGPVQRALRPQPGRRLRSRNQPQADYDRFDAEDSADFDYTPEPEYFNPLAPEYFNPLEPVYAQPEYEQARPAAMPWEGPLNQTPQPVARRLEFQPANLRYLTNPERQLEPDYRPDFSGAAPFQAFQPDEATNRRPSTSTAPSQPAAYTPPADFAAPANFEDNSGPFVAPETAPVSDYASPVQRVSLPGYQAADYIASPVSRPLVQPALSRAVQRTIDSTVERPGAANLGASPAAVTRRLALPNTVARYRALKQAADKVLLGEQSGWEPESAQYAEPAYANPEFNPAGIREAQSAGATLAEVQRIQAETRSLLETQQSTNSFALPVEAAGPAPSNRQSYEVLGLEAAPSPANLPAETGPAPVRTQATSQSQGLPASAANQPIEETPAVLARLPHEDGPVTGPVYRPGSASASVTGPTYRPDLESAPVSFHAAAIRSRPFNRPETAPALFDSVIPASLLDSSFMPGDVSPEIQRSGTTSPITTTGWANKLATLHNNPGVISGAALARQTHEAEASTAWSPEGSARVYAVQRRVRRNENAASETQDRIFGLAENNSLVSEFQPQWLKAMAAEEAAPLLQPVTRSQAISPEVASTHRAISSEVASAAQATAPGVASAAQPTALQPQATALEAQPTARFNPAVPEATVRNNLSQDSTESRINRSFDAEMAAHPEFAFAHEPPNPGKPALALNEGLTGAEIQAVPNQDQAQTGEYAQTSPVGNQSSDFGQAVVAASPVENLQAAPLVGQPRVYDTSGAATAQINPAQRTIQPGGLQPTALQRVFKRLDFDMDDTAGLAESASPGFGNLPFSYAARPGNRRGRTASFDRYDAPGYNPFLAEQYREGSQDYAARPAPEALSANQAGRVYQESFSENRAAQPNSEPAITDNFAREAAFDQETTQAARQSEIDNNRVQPAGQTPLAGAGSRPVNTSFSTEGVALQRTITPLPGDAARFNQPQYLTNSLETAWLSPENRFLVERLPGGSRALQRLLAAPGQVRNYFETNPVAAAIDLPSLRNNPGLMGNLARLTEEQSGSNAGTWAESPGFSYVQRRRANRAAHQPDFDGALPAGDYQGYEQYLAAQDRAFSPDQATPGQPDRLAPGRSEVSSPPSQVVQPGQRPSIKSPDQAGFSQTGADRETAARIQRNYSASAAPGQPAPAGAGSFTITGDWIAQLQSRFDGFSVGQLNGPTGEVMRQLINGGNSVPGMSTPNSGTIPGFGAAPGFNYAVPPLLWRKVSDYTPEDGMAAFPVMRAAAGPAFTSPGDVLRAFDRQDPVLNRSEEDLGPADRTRESASSARLDLPMLRQAHLLLQRISNLEKTNTSLELAHRMEVAGKPGSSIVTGQPLTATGQPGPVQRVTELPERPEPGPEPEVQPTGQAPLRMAGVQVNRPAESRFLEVDADILEDAAEEARPEIRTVEVRVPEHRTYHTPLEAAAARSGSDGPNIGQGAILQPLAIQRKAATATHAATYAPLAQPSLHAVLRTSIGKSLDHPVQRRMTNIFGAHFNDVQVHTGEEAAAATRHVGAEAFTLGSNIYFAPGRYQPDTHTGQALIGHELTHVIQQASLPSLGNGRVPETSSLGQTLEHHAIANEQLLLRHLSNNQDRHDNHDHSLSSSNDGRLSFQGNHFSPSYTSTSSTIERSYQPVADQQYHPPVNHSHLRTENNSNSGSENNGNNSPIQRVMTGSNSNRSSIVQRAADVGTTVNTGGQVNVDDIINNQEDMDKLARKVYRIIRDELMIERERGFGPSNKFF